MPKKNFLLLSLDDAKINKIANIVSNESCKKILDYLSENEGTETEIAQKLQLPLSTVHYNLQQLIESGLIAAEEYHYSPKGREVYHYKLANKYIIIAPKNTHGLREKLRGILPAAIITLSAAALIQIFSGYLSKSSQSLMVAKSAVMDEAAPLAAQKSADTVHGGASIVAEKVYLLPENIALWFLIGALFALIVYIIWKLIRKDY